MGGKKVKEPSLFLLGQIRAGRSKNIKDKLISDLKNVLIKKSKFFMGFVGTFRPILR
mgnify:CR=1 FL=1